MLYSEIQTLLGGGATKEQRRFMLSSESQSTVQGIIDGASGTDCDAAYWERDYGAYDAIVALYDMLSGRDTGASSISINGVLAVTPTLIATSLPMFTGPLTANGAISAGNNAISGQSLNLDNGVGAATLGELYLAASVDTSSKFTKRENYHAAQLGSKFTFFEFEDGDMVFSFPWTDANYDAWGENGGVFRLMNGNGYSGFSVNQRGFLSLGAQISNPITPVGMNLWMRDLYGSNGATSIWARTLTGDDKTTVDFQIGAEINHSTNPTENAAIQFDLDSGGSSYIRFLFDGVSKASIQDSGYLICNGITVLSSGAIATTGALAANTASITGVTNVGSLVSTGAITGTSILATTGAVKAETYLAVNEGANSYAKLTANALDQLLEMKDANNYSMFLGFDNATAAGKAVLAGDFSSLILQAGATIGTPDGEFWLELLASGTATGGLIFTSSQESFALFVDASGVVKSYELGGGYPYGVGPISTGYHKLPVAPLEVDATVAASLNTEFEKVSQRVEGGIVVIDDEADGLVLAVGTGISSDVEVIGGSKHGHVIVGTSTYNITKGDKIISSTYSATGPQTLTIESILNKEGYMLFIKDRGGSATSNNITIATEGSETIDGSATKTISANNGSLILYSDGTNWVSI